MQKLKPCPFCGGKPYITNTEDDIILHHVECNNCFSRGPGAVTKISAILLWNGAKR